MWETRTLLGDPVSLVGNCRVCKEERRQEELQLSLKKKKFKIEAEQEHCSCERLFGSTGYQVDIFQQGGEVSIALNCQLTS